MGALLCRLEEIGLVDPDELDADDLEVRLTAAGSLNVADLPR